MVAWGAAIAVVQWLLVYVAHQPLIAVSGWPLGLAAVAVAVLGGFAGASRARSGEELRVGCYAGLAAGVIQLLVVGWDPAPGGASILVWAPASLVFWCAVGSFGGWVATRGLTAGEALAEPPGMSPRLLAAPAAIAATVSAVLLLAGPAPLADPGAISSAVAGSVRPLGDWLNGDLAVHAQDWFDRLAGAAVLVFAISLARVRSTWIRGLRWSAVAVWGAGSAAGGWLGRLLGTSRLVGAEWLWGFAVRPASGVLLLIVVAALASAVAVAERGEARARASGYDIVLAIGALLLVGSQATLGLTLRARPELQLFHLLFGAAVVLPALVHVAIRGWLEAEHDGPRKRACLTVGALMVAQLGLGIAAYLVPRSVDLGAATGVVDLGLTSVHLWVAAALVVVAVRLVVLSFGTSPR